jgi:hypothetical protein
MTPLADYDPWTAEAADKPTDVPAPPYTDDEPLGTCLTHGDYWTDDCVRCRGYAFPEEQR